MRRLKGLSRIAVGLVATAALLAPPASTWAGSVTMEHVRLRVTGVQGYGVMLVTRDFWGKPIAWRLVRTPNGEAELPWDSSLCNGPCQVEIDREYSEQEFKETWRDLQLKRIADSLPGQTLAPFAPSRGAPSRPAP